MNKRSEEPVRFIPERFRGEVAFVAGGAQGIGKAIATRLALEGADVFIADIDRAMLSRTADEIKGKGCSVRTAICDLSKRVQVERTVAKALQWQGKIDVVMQVAGIADPIPFLKMDEKAWDRHMDINLKGAFLLAQRGAPEHGEAAQRQTGLHGFHELLGRGSRVGPLQCFQGGSIPAGQDSGARVWFLWHSIQRDWPRLHSDQAHGAVF